ncbi:hypothetical protein GCM10009830_28880 [Glycomyces endophyticus]|uniref:histidine kinase n=2 Tax=Glycomyces endophyticus TaxID=480996 RepID=A0ABN2H1M8_9ACTN
MDLRRIPDRWRRLDVTVRDLPLGLLLAALSFLPVLRGHETQVGDLPARPLDALGLAVLALECLPLALRRRVPAASLALVSLGFILASLGSYHTVAGTALPIAVLSAGAHLERFRRTAIAVLTLAYAGLALALVQLGSTEGADSFTMFYLLLAAIWGIGAWLRSTRAAEAERRRHVAAATRAAERTRIARELHDVVTHHVTAMVVQAEAARYLTAAPERLDRALEAIGDTGRLATTDLRHLLDLLDPGHGPGSSRVRIEEGQEAGSSRVRIEEGHEAGSSGVAAGTARVGVSFTGEPGDGRASLVQDAGLLNADEEAELGVEPRAPLVGRLLTLVEQTRRAGQPVEFTEEGAPAEAAGSADLVAYRVVQEGLTNALKHSRGTETRVLVRRRGTEINVEVSSAGAGDGATKAAGRSKTGSPSMDRSPTGSASTVDRSPTAGTSGSGRGLAGLRDRVDLLGGEFEAGPGADGGFTVRARIPAGRPS